MLIPNYCSPFSGLSSPPTPSAFSATPRTKSSNLRAQNLGWAVSPSPDSNRGADAELLR